ncbi:MAG: hypothetical protein H7644_04940 [Candidatus Heimdallarchaeota archaeon]|nr:hypothetical protein [Candidatus Heimdallarchaeota archaeon]MCK5143091.1 hypothetical protein [Candidatus Heimdallarchaeota archaeon]
MKRESIKEESLYTKFKKQQKNQRTLFHDLLMIIRMSIEQAKEPVFDKTIFIARFIRGLQNKHLDEYECLICGTNHLVLDEIRGEQICKNCGLVREEKMIIDI